MYTLITTRSYPATRLNFTPSDLVPKISLLSFSSRVAHRPLSMMNIYNNLIATGKKEDPTWYRTPENQEPNVDQFIEDYEAKCAAEIHQPANDEIEDDNNEEDDDNEENVNNEEDVNIEQDANDENNDNDESDDEEDVLEFYSGVMDQLHQRLFQNIEDPSVKKCTKYFAKKIQNGLKGNLPTLTRTLYQIGGVAAPRGQKRKNSGTMPVQAASKSRRRFKHRGSGAATSGRRVNDMPAHSLNIGMDTGDDEAGDEITFNNVRHSLPSQKKRPKKQHSLAADVQSNRPVSKK